MPIFDLLLGVRKDDPMETMKKFRDAVDKLTVGEHCKQALHASEKYAQKIKRGLMQADQNNQKWLECLCEEQNIYSLFHAIFKVDPECRRVIAAVLVTLLQSRASGFIVSVLATTDNHIIQLVEVYNTRPELAVSCGPILRLLMGHNILTPKIVSKDNIISLLNCMSSDAFDSASDAFETEMLGKPEADAILSNDFNDFVAVLHGLLQSESYVAKRQSIKILADILEKHNGLLQSYIISSDNLKIHMNLMRDKSKSIQYESFMIFQHFVMSEPKSKGVGEILSRNRNKLLLFLDTLDCGKNPTEQAKLSDTKKRVTECILDICPTHSNSSSLVQVDERN